MRSGYCDTDVGLNKQVCIVMSRQLPCEGELHVKVSRMISEYDFMVFEY